MSLQSSFNTPKSPREKAESINALVLTIRSACSGKVEDPENELSFWEVSESLEIVQTMIRDMINDLEAVTLN